MVVYFILEVASINDNRKLYPTDFIKQLLEANAGKVNERFNEEKIRYQDLVESKYLRSGAIDRQEFLNEKEIVTLLAEFSDQVGDIDITAFGADIDIPAYLRRIVIKHALAKNDKDI